MKEEPDYSHDSDAARVMPELAGYTDFRAPWPGSKFCTARSPTGLKVFIKRPDTDSYTHLAKEHPLKGEEWRVTPDSIAREMLRHEFRILRELHSHPEPSAEHIVRAIRLVEGDDMHLVTQYIDGVPLAMLMSMEKDSQCYLNYKVKLDILYGVSQGLCHMHRRRVTYGDLKPANIMVDDYGKATIVDLGSARRRGIGHAGIENVLFTTPEYMSPEASMGIGQTPKSDVFSFALIFFELMTGRKPFGLVKYGATRAGNTTFTSDILQPRYDLSSDLTRPYGVLGWWIHNSFSITPDTRPSMRHIDNALIKHMAREAKNQVTVPADWLYSRA